MVTAEPVLSTTIVFGLAAATEVNRHAFPVPRVISNLALTKA
jgi:hypothetical protein